MRFNKDKKHTILISLVIGFIIGGCLGYIPTKIDNRKLEKSVEYNKDNFIYYRDKYLDECEMYYRIIQVACNPQINDYSALYYIRSTYTPYRLQEIDNAIKYKKAIERNKE